MGNGENVAGRGPAGGDGAGLLQYLAIPAESVDNLPLLGLAVLAGDA